MAFVGVNSGLAGEVFELAEADKLAGVDDGNLLILLAMQDEEGRQLCTWEKNSLGRRPDHSAMASTAGLWELATRATEASRPSPTRAILRFRGKRTRTQIGHDVLNHLGPAPVVLRGRISRGRDAQVIR